LNQNGSAVFNEQGDDVDLRVEGDTDTSLFFVDASADMIGVSTTSPAYTLDIDSATADIFRAKGTVSPGTTFEFVGGDDVLSAVSGISGGGSIYTTNSGATNSFLLSGDFTNFGYGDHTTLVGYSNQNVSPSTSNLIAMTTSGLELKSDGGSIDTEVNITSSGGLVVTGQDQTATDAFVVNDSASVEQFSVLNDGTVKINDAYTFPTSDGSTNQILKTNGSGALSFADDSTLTGITDSDETSLGIDAGGSLTTGTNLTAVGNGAGAAVTEGDLNDFFGASAGASVTTGSFNTLLGNLAGQALTTEGGNTIIGSGAGDAFTGSDDVVIIGKNAVGGSSPTGGTGVVIGADSATEMDGSGNVLVGHQVASGITSGEQNVVIGTSAGGSALTTGSNNVFVGYQAGDGVNVSSALAIGDGADPTASNQALIGGATTNITDVYFGSGVTDSSAAAVTINATGNEGTDESGVALNIAGGKATGNAAGGKISFQTSDAGASGTTLQSLTEKARIEADGGFFLTSLASGTGGGGFDALCISASTDEVTVNTNGDDCVTSSLRFKTGVEDLNLGLDFINKLQPRSFTYKADGSDRIGFIAEEIQYLDERLVFYERDGETVRGVHYQDFSAILAKAIQELDEKVETIEYEKKSRIREEMKDFFSSTKEKVVHGVTKLFAKEVYTEKLCVGDTCVTEDDLKILLEKVGAYES
jgi:hypothetical protein